MDMPKTYTKKQLWELYKKLPQEIRDMLFSLEASDNIYNICQKNNLSEEKVSEVSDYINQVLFGVLPPDDFQKVLEKELKLKAEIAKKVAQEINRFIFYPVRPALEELYRIGPAKPTERKEEVPTSEEKPEEVEKELKPPPRSDTYRESIE